MATRTVTIDKSEIGRETLRKQAQMIRERQREEITDYSLDVKIESGFNREIRRVVKDRAEMVAEKMLQAGLLGAKKVEELIGHPDPRVAGENARFSVNHSIGMPTSKNINQNYNYNVDSLLD